MLRPDRPDGSFGRRVGFVGQCNFHRIAIVDGGVVLTALHQSDAATIPQINGWNYQDSHECYI